MKHFYKIFNYACLLMCFLLAGKFSYADGSKDMYPVGIKGNRAFLFTTTNELISPASWPFKSLGTHYVYAKLDETIAIASSAQGYGEGVILLTAPNGDTYSSVKGSMVGRIPDRAGELAGPRAPGQAAGGNRYIPFEQVVGAGQDGVWKIEFRAIENTSIISQTPAAPTVAADGAWTQSNLTGTSTALLIAAWDISVRNTANSNWINGRVYANMFNLLMPQTFDATQTYYVENYVLTRDGVAYKVTNNGSNGVGFTFFVNNKGYIDSDGVPIYKSLNNSTPAFLAGKVHDPRKPDDATNITHKIFYTKPASDLPKDAKLPGGTTTWLKNDEKIPTVSAVGFIGAEGTPGRAGTKGGFVLFDSDLSGSYRIEIGGITFPKRVLTGLCVVGNNKIKWDGKAGTVADPLIAGASVAAGLNLGEIKVQLFGAEVHFPYIDMEINPGGIIIERTDAVNYDPIAGQDIIYWDDRDITGGVTTVGPSRTRFNDYPGFEGISSNVDGHIWGNNLATAGNSGNSGNGAYSFGNEKSMDTWSYVAGNIVKEQVSILIAVADLEITSITPNSNTVSVGGQTTYTVVVKNINNVISLSDVTDAKFAFNFPAGLTNLTVSNPVFSGGGSETSRDPLAATSFTSLLNLASGETATYTITGTIGSSLAGSSIPVEATIMRPPDVTDPDATSDGLPTDPYIECDGTAGSDPGVGCNNIKSSGTVFVAANSAPVANPDVNSTNQNVTLIVNAADGLLKNDTDPDPGTVLVVTKYTINGIAGDQVVGSEVTITEGKITINANGSYQFVPALNYSGAVPLITYTISDGNGGTASSTLTLTVVPQNPSIKLVKTGVYVDTDNNGKVNAGDKINYSFTVENTGDVTVKDITITDADAGIVVTGAAVTLAPGAKSTGHFTASYTLTQSDIDKGGVYNLATAKGTDPKGGDVTDDSENGNPIDPKGPPVDPNCPTCTITPLPQDPSIKLVKSGVYVDTDNNGKVNAGDKINYSFTVENTGNVTVKDITITDADAGIVVTGAAVTLAPGAKSVGHFTASYTLTQSDIDKGGVYNLATAKGTDPKGGDVTDDSENGNPIDPKGPPVDPNCPTCTITPLPQAPSIKLVKSGVYVDTDNNGKVNAGDKINYSFTVENTGNVTVKDIKITDADAGIVVVGTAVTLAPGAKSVGHFTASYTLTQSDIDKGGVYNLATAKGTDPKGGDVTDDSENGNPIDPKGPPVDPNCPTCTITPLPQAPSIKLVKSGVYVDTDNNGKVNAGDKINYSFTVENTGNVTVKDIKITDADAGIVVVGTAVTLAPGAKSVGHFTASYTLTQSDIDKGGVYNLATAKGTDPKGGDVTDDSENGNPIDPKGPPVDPNCPTCTITPLPQAPSIKLVKSGVYVDTDNNGKVNAGDKINYSFTVENTGNVTVKDIKITDADAGIVVVGTAVTLAPGAKSVGHFTASYTLTQSDIDKGGVYNLATAKGTDPKGGDVTDDSENGNPIDPKGPPVDPNCPTCTITPLPQAPSIKLVKSGVYVDTDNNGKVNAGDKINYSFTVENTGNVTVKDIKITDADAGIVVVGTAVTLAPGAKSVGHFTASYTLTQSDIDKGGVYNLATAKGTDPKGGDVTDDSENGNPIDPKGPPVDPNCPTCTITPLPQAPSIKLVKSGVYVDTDNNGKVNAGDKINYSFTVENTGNVTVKDIKITDADAGIVVIGAAVTLAPGAKSVGHFTASYTLTQSDIDKGGVYNLATAKGTDPKGGDVTDDSENGNPIDPKGPPVDPNCPTCTITPLPQAPSIKLVKSGVYVDTDNNGKVNAGDKINYSFTVENTGNVTVKDIKITDADAGIVVVGTAVTLAPGAKSVGHFTASYTLTQSDIDKGGVYNLATAKGTDPKGGDVTDDSENGNPIDPKSPPVDPNCPTCTITPLPQAPSIKLVKSGVYVDTDNNGKVNAGDKINYSFTVENTGNVTVKDIKITDADAGIVVIGAAVTLAPGAKSTGHFTASYTLTQSDIDKGGVYNLATAKGTDPKGGDVTDDSENGNPIDPKGPPVDPNCPTCTITPLPQAPSIKLVKSGVYVDTDNNGKVNAGDKINYSFTVENTGNVTVKDIKITDADAGIVVTGAAVTLAPGAKSVGHFTASYTLTQSDIDKGGVYNLATAKGTDPKGGDVTDDSENGNPIDPKGPPVDPNCPTCTITPLPQDPSINLIKKVTNAGSGELGAFILNDKIEYTFTIKNTGNTTLKDIVLSDPLLGNAVINIPGSLAPGLSVTHKEFYTITAADVTAGKVTNKAVVHAKDPKGGDVTDESGTATDNDNPTVTVVAKPPVANDDAATTKQNKPVTVEVQKNDAAGSSPIVPGSTHKVSEPANGTAVVNADGTVIYTPKPGYVGPDEFTYTITDKNGQISNVATVKVTVIPTKPEAIDDVAETQFNKEVIIPILSNDKPDGDPLDKNTIEITEQPKHGTLVTNIDGTVTYLPKSGYTGPDTFKYRVKDVNGNWTNVATVNITVKGFFIPNVITPNGDGKNDQFVIVGLENFNNAELTIFNRWGNEVYRNNNYRNTWNGDGLNEGTYYYMIRLKKDNKLEVYKGWVLIKR